MAQQQLALRSLCAEASVSVEHGSACPGTCQRCHSKYLEQFILGPQPRQLHGSVWARHVYKALVSLQLPRPPTQHQDEKPCQNLSSDLWLGLSQKRAAA